MLTETTPDPFDLAYTRDSDSFVISAAAPIATGWNDSCRTGNKQSPKVHAAKATPRLALPHCASCVVIDKSGYERPAV